MIISNIASNKDIKSEFRSVRKVIWDCDNTIWIHRKDEVNIIADYFGIKDIEEFGIEYFDTFNIFYESFVNEKAKKEKLVDIVEKALPILKKYGIDSSEFVKGWSTIETSFLNSDVFEVLDYLTKKKYENLILTDWFEETQYHNLKLYGLLDYFSQISTCDDQYLKTNPKSAQRIIKKGREEEYVIIGDSLKSDIAFASHSGIKSIWFNPEGRINTTNFIPTLQIKRLSEIYLIL